MSIKVVCPNGHALKVKEELAGKLGLCPVCKARVQVPALQPSALSEDAILDIVESPVPRPKPAPVPRESSPSGTPGTDKKERQSPPKKICTKCRREIVAGIHICPYCHTYIAKLGDF